MKKNCKRAGAGYFWQRQIWLSPGLTPGPERSAIRPGRTHKAKRIPNTATGGEPASLKFSVFSDSVFRFLHHRKSSSWVFFDNLRSRSLRPMRDPRCRMQDRMRSGLARGFDSARRPRAVRPSLSPIQDADSQDPTSNAFGAGSNQYGGPVWASD